MKRKTAIIASAAVAVIAAFAVLWKCCFSPTKIAFVNYQVADLGQIAKANTDSFIRIDDLPVEDRCFSYDAMLNTEGKLVNHWHKGSSVPDVSRTETQLWFYYLAGSYMQVGCEAFHLGQIELIGMNDPERDAWAKVIGKIRELARTKARRHWVILDAHTPYGGMVKDGKSLLDFNSFPLRIKEIPEKP